MSSEIDFSKMKVGETVHVSAAQSVKLKTGAAFEINEKVQIINSSKKECTNFFVKNATSDYLILAQTKGPLNRTASDKLHLIRLILDNKL